MGWLAAIISGTLAGLAYPVRVGGLIFPDLGFLGFFCWVPLMLVIRGQSPRRAFALSFMAGLFHFVVSQFWLYEAVHNFGGLSPSVSLMVLGLLLIILAAYFGLIFLASQWICRNMGWPTLWVRPVFWVGIEYLRHLMPMDGYPWSQLGYTQSGFLPFIQSAQIWGAYGLTFLLVLSNEVLTAWFFRGKAWERPPRHRWIHVALLLLLANLGFGLWRFHQGEPKTVAALQVGVVQGNIAQEDKWNRQMAQNILALHMDATRELQAQGAELVLWPEASVPFTHPYDAGHFPVETGLSQGHLILGAITRPRIHLTPGMKPPVYNTALVLNPEQEILDYYHKKELVPFGEYVPYQDLFWFARQLTVEVGRMQPGESFRPVRLGDFLMGILICYEDIFPYAAREMVGRGANALINLTNDAWYGYTSAAYQHLVYSQYRSVETGRYMIRATNTGISALIDTRGRVLWQGDLFTRENFLTTLPLFDGKTLFVRIGYLLPHLFLILMAVNLIQSGMKQKSWQKNEAKQSKP